MNPSRNRFALQQALPPSQKIATTLFGRILYFQERSTSLKYIVNVQAELLFRCHIKRL